MTWNWVQFASVSTIIGSMYQAVIDQGGQWEVENGETMGVIVPFYQFRSLSL